MKITIRIILSLIIVVAAVAIIFSFQQVRTEKSRLAGDLERRAIILGESLQESVKPLVHALEQSVIDFLRERAIEAERRTGAPGVYVNAKKIAQLGLRIRQGTSYHGLAFNIDMDLEPFRRIAPCGIQGLEVTQLAALLPREEKLFALAAAGLRTHLLHHLGYNAAPTPSPGPA